MRRKRVPFQGFAWVVQPCDDEQIREGCPPILQKSPSRVEALKAQYWIEGSLAGSEPNAQPDLHPHVSFKSLQMDVAPDPNLDSLKTSCQQLLQILKDGSEPTLYIYTQVQVLRLSPPLLLFFFCSHLKVP
jgi:hypothetical protein